MSQPVRQATFLGHPVGLFVLFFTEMWERFSYYGMRALLILYMTNYFKWTQEYSSSIYKWYTSLVYLTPLIGGFLADRYLGNRNSIIIGASLMSLGHFAMAFENHNIFYTALALLIIGNGFFKPNMSTQVGRLYPANDPRRDSAYTIFYMGINLGAFLSPLICGYLRENFNGGMGYHYGFAAAGIGMVLGLITYLVFLPWIQEVRGDAAAPENASHSQQVEQPSSTPTDDGPMSEAKASQTPAVIPALALSAPLILNLAGVATVVGSIVLAYLKAIKIEDAVAFGFGGGFACFMGSWIISQVSNALRDRIMAIYAVAVVVVFFWAAFEQAGNTMNLYADNVTQRYLTVEPPAAAWPPTIAASEEVAVSTGWMDKIRKAIHKFLNPVSTEAFQSINALAIFLMAPIFAWLWTALPRWGIQLSIASKMGLGVLLQGFAFVLMFQSVAFENKPSEVTLNALPAGFMMNEKGTLVFRDSPDLGSKTGWDDFDQAMPGDPDFKKVAIVHGGRIEYAESDKKLKISGVMPTIDRDRLLRAAVTERYMKQIRELSEKYNEVKKSAPETPAPEGENVGGVEASIQLDPLPPGFDLVYAGFKPDQVTFDPETATLTTHIALADKDYKSLLLAGAEPSFRDAVGTVWANSQQFKVGASWLLWFYILCTLGELCLSPVGLSMVSKLAPAKFATMLMGMWLLTSFFGNFTAGLLGEMAGETHPATYFGQLAGVLIAAALVWAVMTGLIRRMMHGVV